MSKPRLKRPYREIRAHSNPLSAPNFEYPVCPDDMDWSPFFPAYHRTSSTDLAAVAVPTAAGASQSSPGSEGPPVVIADIGCGYGGLLVALGSLFPDKLTLGMEIREPVEKWVKHRIESLRTEHKSKNLYQNIAVMRTNAMKLLPNYFRKGQLEKMFFLFPDPHFKRAKHNRRIISVQLLAEYAFCLQIGGLLYTVTDVKDLHEWMVEHCDQSPLFTRLSEDQLAADPCIPLILSSSEEAKKVDRAGGSKYMAIYKRVQGYGEEPPYYNASTMYWTPRELFIEVGDSVRWDWIGPHNMVQSHNASSEVQLFDSHGLRGFGQEEIEPRFYFWTFTRPGVFHYLCVPHAPCCDMRGVIHVGPRAAHHRLDPAPAFDPQSGQLQAQADGSGEPCAAAAAIDSHLDDPLDDFQPAIVQSVDDVPDFPDIDQGRNGDGDGEETGAKVSTMDDASPASPSSSSAATGHSLPHRRKPVSWAPFVALVVVLILLAACVVTMVRRAKNHHDQPPPASAKKYLNA